MLIVIHYSIKEVLLDNAPQCNEAISVLEDMANSLQRGKHIVFAFRDTIQHIIDIPTLSPRAKSVYRYVQTHLPELRTYYDSLVRRIELVSNNLAAESYVDEHCQVFRLPIRHFSDFMTFGETVLLTENLTDARFYIKLTEAFLARESLGRLPLQYEIRGGGGNTTAQNYTEIQNTRQRLCLCIVDSDKKTPTDNIGSTAQNVLNSNDNNCLLTECYVIRPRDVENLIPISVLRELEDVNYNSMIDFLTLLESKSAEAKLYVDIKNGLRLGELYHRSPNNSSYTHYWSNILSITETLQPYRKDVRKYERIEKEVIIASDRIPTKERN